MTVTTAGPIRGLLGRWIMRFEAAGQIITMMFQGTTAVSALSGVLAYSGYEQYVPIVLGVGILATFVFAYVYVELGVYNRKNREKNDRGSNYAGPTMRIDDELIARGMLAAQEGRELHAEERAAIKGELDHAWKEYRNGIPIDD